MSGQQEAERYWNYHNRFFHFVTLRLRLSAKMITFPMGTFVLW